MKKLLPLLSGGVIGALLVVLGVTFNLFKLGPAERWSASMCEATVRLKLVSDGTPTGKTIVADPAHPVCLAVGQPMNWEIVDLDKGTVTIGFLPDSYGRKGPFPENPNLLNDDASKINERRGEYVVKNVNTTTEPFKVKTPGAEDYQQAWHYTIKWTPPGSTDPPIKLDPVVCIRR